MSRLKISCLSIDCPERTGGVCRYDPRTPIKPEVRQVLRNMLMDYSRKVYQTDEIIDGFIEIIRNETSKNLQG